MTTVKGSKEYQWQVVKIRPHAVLWRNLILGAIIIVLMSAAYFVGRYPNGGGQGSFYSVITSLKSELKNTKASEQQIRQEKVNVVVGAEVDKQAAEELRKEVIELKSVISQLQEENLLYRKLVSPNEVHKGLSIGSINIRKVADTGQFKIKLVIQQLNSDKNISGSVAFKVIGKLNDIEHTLTLKELDVAGAEDRIKLNLKYFQTVEGLWSLPEGFVPSSVEIEATPTANDFTSVNKRFAWPAIEGESGSSST